MRHVDIAARATTLFDVVVIGIVHNIAKAGRHLLDAHERLRLVREATPHLPSVEVDIIPELLADYYTQHSANAIIKDLRSGNDLDAELPITPLNCDLRTPETVFLPASAAYVHISPPLVKDVVDYGQDTSAPVPPIMAHALAVRLAQVSGSTAHDGINSGLIPPRTPPSRLVGADHTRGDLP